MRHMPDGIQMIFSGRIQSILFAVILCIALIGVLNNFEVITKNPIVRFLTENSFSIYVLHILVIYTFSLTCWMDLNTDWRYDIKFTITLGLTILVLFLAAKIYTVTLGKYSDRLIEALGNVARRKTDKNICGY